MLTRLTSKGALPFSESSINSFRLSFSSTSRVFRLLEYRRYFGGMQEEFPEFKALCDEYGDNEEIMCALGDEVNPNSGLIHSLLWLFF